MIDRNRLSSLASRLVSIPSVNPPGDLGEIAGFVKEWLESNGFSVELYEPARGKVSVVSKLGYGDRRVIFNGHLDVVPVGDKSKWSFDPFSGEVRGGKLLGRGASDMKGGCASLMEAFATLQRHEKELGGEVVLSLVPDEETGGHQGTGFLVERGILKGDVAIIAEPSGLDTCVVGEKGALWGLVKALGKPGHGSMAGYVGDNAIEKLFAAIPSLKKLHGRRVKPPRGMEETLRETSKLLTKLLRNKSAARIADGIIINVGVVRGGVKVNVVPDEAEMEVDIRLPLTADPKRIEGEVRRLLRRHGLVFETMWYSPPNYSRPTDRYLRLLLSVIQSKVKRRVATTIIWGGTDGKYLRRAGIPTAIYGPGGWEGIHSYNESVDLHNLYICAEIYVDFARRALAM